MIVPDLVKAVTDGQKKARDEIQGKCFMNKRLQELYIEASEQFKIVQDQGLPAPYQTRAFAEKFAELIVRECADVGSKFSLAHPEAIRYQIKRHFGVEE